MPQPLRYKLTREWEHCTLEEALDHKLQEALAWAARGERSLPYSRIPGLLMQVLEPVSAPEPETPRPARVPRPTPPPPQ